MFDYAIGDVQGCYDLLRRLLDSVGFNEQVDRLWFVGDLVNRGSQSLEVLRFIKSLPITPRITLGNHDLHFLGRLFGEGQWHNDDDTLEALLTAPDAEELGHWLRHQPVLYHDAALHVVMSHAGIAPCWDLATAKCLASELEVVLQGDDYREFLTHMYSNKPDYWSETLRGLDRLRVICNYFTRMRFCDQRGHLVLTYKGTVEHAPKNLYPWFRVPHRYEIKADIVFGHWAALRGECAQPHIYALDTGAIWGGSLTALRLQDKRRFQVS